MTDIERCEDEATTETEADEIAERIAQHVADAERAMVRSRLARRGALTRRLAGEA
jgi:hypothetical protein